MMSIMVHYNRKYFTIGDVGLYDRKKANENHTIGTMSRKRTVAL